MPQMHPLQFTIEIAAPPERVWAVMLAPASYEQWTAAFAEGSRYEGSWDEGATIRFVAPSGDGMLARIAENRPHRFLSIEHLAMIRDGTVDRDSDEARAWTPAFENYTFEPILGGTRLVIDIDTPDDYAAFMQETWPQALDRLKIIVERG